MKNTVKQRRTELDMTMQSLADSLGINMSAVQVLEKQGSGAPKLDIAYAVALLLETTVEELWPNEMSVIEKVTVTKRIKLPLKQTKAEFAKGAEEEVEHADT